VDHAVRIKFSVKDDAVRAELRYATKTVPENARKEMHRAADRIVKQAKLNAPVESGALEDSIRKERSTGDRGRLQLDIVAGGEGDLDRYALIMHESDYELGPRSRAKQQAVGGRAKVGRKFVTRAVNKEKKTIREGIAAVVSQTISRLFSNVRKRLGR
jgi:hypothetical protein